MCRDEVTGGRRENGGLARGPGAFLPEVMVEVFLIERLVLLFPCEDGHNDGSHKRAARRRTLL